jgi:peptidoglycan/xylan/chitin deacetylase (PgdA/CDA1 family)
MVNTVGAAANTVDAVARGASVIKLDRDFTWPRGRRVAIVLNVAYEGWSDGKAPGLGPMGNPLPPGVFDTNALSWGSYGANRGIDRLLRILEKSKARASIMVSGVFAERTPDILKRMVEDGHEIVAHAYAQDIIPASLTADACRADIIKTTEAIAAASGVRPIGWISPRGTPSPDTARFLVEAGYQWHGDAFDDDRPYLQVLGDRRIVAIPLTMDINDLPHAMRFGRSARQFVELFDDLLERSGGADDLAVSIDVTAHAHVYGHPAGAWAYEVIALKALGRDDVWVATRTEVAAYVLKSAA